MFSKSLQKTALDCAALGLDFFIRTQADMGGSADHGRYLCIANIVKEGPVDYTSNWLTGIIASNMLDMWHQTGEERFRQSAEYAVRYLKCLQDTATWHTRTFGAMHEVVPTHQMAHPRDGLSAATGLLDYAAFTGDEDAMTRAELFGKWFITYGMEPGYPYWTLTFDGTPWEPFWHGSFHSGSAYFMTRLWKATGNENFLAAARKILDFYNANMLSETGDITVIREHNTLKAMDDVPNLQRAPIGWIRMHKYNDDFGALANMVVGKYTGVKRYSEKAMLFLKRMRELQRADGGFGPDCWEESIPNAAGMILIELMTAKELGLADESFDDMAEKIVRYLIGIQVNDSNSRFNGAFHGMDNNYTVNRDYCNARAGIYAIMALLRFAGKTMQTYSVNFPDAIRK